MRMRCVTVKLNPDCVRDILLEIERLDFNETTNPDKLHDTLPDYSVEQLTYTCLKLGEGEFIMLITVDVMGSYQPGIKCVVGLTYKGHEFLEKVRPKSVWDKVLSAAKGAETFSLDIIGKVAVTVLAELAKAQLKD